MTILAQTTSNAPSAQKKKRGFTLTEIAIVLGIVGLILGAVWAAAKNVYSNVGSAKAQEVASVLIAGVRGTFASQTPTTGDLSTAFSQYSFTDGTTTFNPRITAGVQTTGNLTAGFTVALDGQTETVNGVTYGAALGTTSADAAICNGMQTAALNINGSNVSQTIAGALAPVVANCSNTGTCPARGGYIPNSSTCTANAANACVYTQVGLCSPNTANNSNGLIDVVLFIPWQS